jgi:hypothetical protein
MHSYTCPLREFLDEMRKFEENQSNLPYKPPKNNIQRMDILINILNEYLGKRTLQYKSIDCRYEYSVAINEFIREMRELEESEPETFFHDIPKNNTERMEIIISNLKDMISFD